MIMQKMRGTRALCQRPGWSPAKLTRYGASFHARRTYDRVMTDM